MTVASYHDDNIGGSVAHPYIQLELDLESPLDKRLKAVYYDAYMEGHRDASNRKMSQPGASYSGWANRPHANLEPLPKRSV